MRLIDADVLLKNLEWLEDDDRYVLHDVKSTMDETPTVPAIPIEWMKEKAIKYGCFVFTLNDMINDWEKENEN